MRPIKLREIRFRAWFEKYKKMVIVKAFNFMTEEVIYFDESQDDDQVEKGGILMQLTGLLDKNGKEIYEGDVVESDLDKVMREVVVWDEYCFALRDNSTGFRQIRIEDWQWEVIGNIYENPELLEAKDV